MQSTTMSFLETDTCCSHCRSTGHTIRMCDDPLIENTWQNVLHIGNPNIINYTEIDFAEQKRFLTCDVSNSLFLAMTVQFCNAIYNEDSIDTILEKVFLTIKAKYAQWNTQWLSESTGDFSDLSELMDLEENIEIIDVVDIDDKVAKKTWIVQPMMLCLETAEELVESVDCPICLDSFTKIQTITTNCNHVFCRDCLCKHLDNACLLNNPACPMCRGKITTLEIKDIDFYEPLYNKYGVQSIVQDDALLEPTEVTNLESWLDAFELFSGFG